MANPNYWPGKLTQTIYHMVTADGTIQERLHEALHRVSGLDVSIRNDEHRKAWAEPHRITSNNTKTLRIRYKTASRAACILFELV